MPSPEISSKDTDAVQAVLDLGSWFVMRTAHRHTIRLQRALGELGYRSWAPVAKKLRRIPRSKKSREIEFAMMPTYVFGQLCDLDSIRQLARNPASNVPYFSIFRFGGGIALVADAELNALREEELQRQGLKKYFQPRKAMPVVERGTAICLSEGPFAGLEGIVEGQNGSFAMVSFAGFNRPIKISSLLLDEDRS